MALFLFSLLIMARRTPASAQAGDVPILDPLILTDEKAMGDLYVEVEEMSDQEWALIESADDEAEDYIEQLERLSELRDKGIIT